MDCSNFLAAFCLLVFILGFFRSCQAPLEELESLVEVTLVLELDGNNLINTDKLPRYFLFELLVISTVSFFESSFQIAHGVKNVEHLFFTNSETHVSLGLPFSVLPLNAHIEALFVEVGSRFIIVQLFKLGCDYSTLLQTVWNMSFPIVLLGIDQIF